MKSARGYGSVRTTQVRIPGDVRNAWRWVDPAGLLHPPRVLDAALGVGALWPKTIFSLNVRDVLTTITEDVRHLVREGPRDPLGHAKPV